MRHSGLLILTLLVVAGLHAEPVPVRHPQGSAHGFLALSALDGTRIAVGDVTQVIHGSQVTSRVIFRFRDGSVDDDTTVFSQRGTFRLISNHHIQRGPSFPKPIDILIDALTGRYPTVIIRRHRSRSLTSAGGRSGTNGFKSPAKNECHPSVFNQTDKLS
jgi:hypothetical protein